MPTQLTIDGEAVTLSMMYEQESLPVSREGGSYVLPVSDGTTTTLNWAGEFGTLQFVSGVIDLVDGAAIGTAAGISAVAGVGASINAVSGTAAGAGVASGVGASVAAAVGASSGTSTVSGVGDAVLPGFENSVGTSAGSSTVSGVGGSIAATVGTAAGSSTVAGVGDIADSIEDVIGTAAGSSDVSGVGASIAATVGTAAGASTVAGVGGIADSVAEAVGASAGSSAVSGVGASVSAAAGTSAGSSTVSGVGDVASSVAEAVGTSAGSAAVSGVCASITASAGSAAGAATVAGVGEAVGGVVSPVTISDFDVNDAAGSATLSVTAGAGDVVIFCDAQRTSTAPALKSGFTNIEAVNAASARSLRLQYKISAGGTETVTSTSDGLLVCCSGGRSIGSSGVYAANTSGGTIPLPDLTGLDTSGNGLIIAGCYYSSLITDPSDPYIVQDDNFLYILENTEASLVGETFFGSGSTRHTTFAVEIRPT